MKIKYAKGSFNNYMDRILPFFDLSPCVDIFYALSVDKNRHFFYPLPPHLVHVVIEWPSSVSPSPFCPNESPNLIGNHKFLNVIPR